MSVIKLVLFATLRIFFMLVFMYHLMMALEAETCSE
jgi:hypothetical protein